MIYQEKPKNFNPKFDVVSCFLENNGDILLLHRQDHKPEGDTWGVPAGKVDEGEKIKDTMVREIWEETGFTIKPEELLYFGKIYVKYPEYDFVYHIFHAKTDQKDVIIREQEHKGYKWLSPEQALQMPLIEDLDNCIKLFYKI